MTVDRWLLASTADAQKRGWSQLTPLLEGLAESLKVLRSANFADSATSRSPESSAHASDPVADMEVEPRSPAAHTSRTTSSRAAKTRMEGYAGTASLTIEALGEQLRRGQTSAVETTSACLRAIEARNAELNAFILVMRDAALAQAQQADEELASGHDRGPLHGVPVSLKDLVDIRGLPTTAGSRVRAHDVAPHDAPAVVHLKHAGAVLIGKTNLHEFAFGTTNEDSGFGAARHPLDRTRSPGGSSGGSAVSVASGMAFGSVGSDTGGSIRIPSAACGLVGLKPTFGEASTEGVVPLSPTLDHVGPLARSVADAWHLHQAICGRHERRALSAASMAGLRVGVPHRYFCDLLAPDVRAAFDDAVASFERAGVRMGRVSFVHADHIASVYLGIVFAEAAAYHAPTLESSPELYTEPVRLRLELARYLLAEDYLRAMAGRVALRRAVDAALSVYDVLILPTLPIAAPPLGAATIAIDGREQPVRNLMLRLTQLFNITGHPAVSLPCGGTREGLPIGLQLVGRRHETEILVRVAMGAERLLASSNSERS